MTGIPLRMPAPPVDRLPDEERTARKIALAVAFRAFAELGFDEGVAGHMTARDPIEPNTFWVNPFGISFGTISASDLVRVDEQGRVIDGGEVLVNAAAFAIHAAIHAQRPEIVSAAHTHSPAGRAWSTLGRLLDPITQDACGFFGRHSIYGPYRGGVLDLDEGRDIAQALGSGVAVILANHGLLTVGETVEATAFRFIAMERCCRVQLDAEAAGTPVLIDEEVARQTGGSEQSAWFGFQPWYQRMTRACPDVLR